MTTSLAVLLLHLPLSGAGVNVVPEAPAPSVVKTSSPPPSGAAVTFEADWLLSSYNNTSRALGFDFVYQMHTDVVLVQGLEASRSAWDWSFLEIEGAVVPGPDGTVIEVESAPFVNLAAWEFSEVETAEALYEIGHDQLWRTDLFEAPFALLSQLPILELVGVLPLWSSQEFFPYDELGTAVRAAGGSLVTTVDESGGFSASDTRLTLDDASSLAAGDFLRIDGEILEVSSVDPNLVDVDVLRGREDTADAAHDDGSRVYAVQPQSEWFGSPVTVSTSSIDAAATIVSVRLGGEFSDGDVIRMRDESMLVSCSTEPCGNDLTVSRGFQGTAAVAHPEGTSVKRFRPVAHWTLDQLLTDEVQRGAGSIDFSLGVEVRRSFDLRKFLLMHINAVEDFLQAGHLAVGSETPVAFDQSIDIEYRPDDPAGDLWTYKARLWFDSEATFDSTVALFNNSALFDPVLLRQFLLGAPEFNGTNLLSRTVTCRPAPTWTHQDQQCIDGVPTAPDLGITISNSPLSATPGQSLGYTIVASNDGLPNSAVSVSDNFPAGLSCSWTSLATGGASGNTDGSGDLADNLDMPSFSTVTYTVDCAIDPGASGVLSNTATISSPQDDFDPDDDSATASTALEPFADLSISKTDGVEEVQPGGATVYTVVARNHGPSAATAVVTDLFPADLSCSWTSLANGDAVGNTDGSGHLSDALSLPPGASVTYTALCDIDASATGTLSNNATITSAVDNTPSNNSATDNSRLTTPPGFAKAFSPSTIAKDAVSTLTFTVDNSDNALGVGGLAFSDDLPAGLVVASPPNAATNCTGGILIADPAASTISYLGGSVAGSGTCTLSVDVTSSLGGSYLNVSSVLTSAVGEGPQATDTLVVLAPPGFTKAFTPGSIAVGEVSTLTFTIDNSGSLLAANELAFADNLPSALSFAPDPAESTTCAGGDITMNGRFLTFASGSVSGSGTCTVSVDVTSSTPGVHRNTSSQLSSSAGSSNAALADLIVLTSLSVSGVAASEGSGIFEFTVTRSHGGTEVSATVAAVTGSAEAGVDFVAAPQVLSFAADGPLSAVYQVQIVDDSIVEPAETFTVQLSAPVNAVIAAGTALGTIEPDGDNATVSLQGVQAPEAAGPFLAQLTLDHPVAIPVSVDLSTFDITAQDQSGDGDYQSLAGHTVTFPPLSTQQSVAITVHDDDKLEMLETFGTELSQLQAGGLNVSFDPSPQSNGIENDDAVTLSVSDRSRAEGSGGGTDTLVVTIELQGESAIDLSFDYRTVEGTAQDEESDGDYLGVEGQASIMAGTTRATVEVEISRDEIEETDEFFFVDLSNPSPAATVSFADPRGRVTLEDDDDQGPPRVLGVSGPGGNAVNECTAQREQLVELALDFDQPLRDPAGDHEHGDVSNPASYLLVQAGDDGDFSTVNCAGGSAGDDVSIPIDAAAWDGSGSVTLRWQDNPLAGDLYQLHACASLSDFAGNGLDGDGLGGPVEDFVRRFRLDPSNLFDNGQFDHCGTGVASLAPWTAEVEAPSTVDVQGLDAQASPLSASARLTGLGPGAQITLSQCVQATGRAAYELSARVRQGPDTADVEMHAFCVFFSEPQCTSGELGAAAESFSLNGTGGQFIDFASVTAAPVGSSSAQCGFDFRALTTLTFEVEIDELTLYSDGGLFFADGFELGDTSAWSSEP